MYKKRILIFIMILCVSCICLSCKTKESAEEEKDKNPIEQTEDADVILPEDTDLEEEVSGTQEDAEQINPDVTENELEDDVAANDTVDGQEDSQNGNADKENGDSEEVEDTTGRQPIVFPAISF